MGGLCSSRRGNRVHPVASPAPPLRGRRTNSGQPSRSNAAFQPLLKTLRKLKPPVNERDGMFKCHATSCSPDCTPANSDNNNSECSLPPPSTRTHTDKALAPNGRCASAGELWASIDRSAQSPAAAVVKRCRPLRDRAWRTAHIFVAATFPDFSSVSL